MGTSHWWGKGVCHGHNEHSVIGAGLEWSGQRQKWDLKVVLPQRPLKTQDWPNSTEEAGKFSLLSSNAKTREGIFHCPVFSGSSITVKGSESHPIPLPWPAEGTDREISMPPSRFGLETGKQKELGSGPSGDCARLHIA